MIEIINKPLLLHLVGYLYYWQMGFNSVFKGLISKYPSKGTILFPIAPGHSQIRTTVCWMDERRDDQKKLHDCLNFHSIPPLFGRVHKFAKTTISFVISVCPSVRPHGSSRLPLDGFLSDFIFEYFSKTCRQN